MNAPQTQAPPVANGKSPRAIHVRDVPEDIYLGIHQIALRRRVPLREYVIEILTEALLATDLPPTGKR